MDLALDRTRPDNLSLTALMWMQVEELERCIAADRLAPDFLDGARTAAESMRGKRVAPFPDFLRERIYRHYLRLIRARDTAIPVTLCTESVELWRALEADLAVTPGTYVCGCGAGATPQLRRLATNPWDEARAAAHLDGTLVFKGQDEVFKRA